MTQDKLIPRQSKGSILSIYNTNLVSTYINGKGFVGGSQYSPEVLKHPEIGEIWLIVRYFMIYCFMYKTHQYSM